MKRTLVYLITNILALYILMSFFFGNGSVSHLIKERRNLLLLQNQLSDKQLTLLNEENALMESQSPKNIDENLLKHGYKPENTIIFRFVQNVPHQSQTQETNLLARLYLTFFVLLITLFTGEILVYFISKKGETQL